jgi:hypothetical protein
MGSCPDIMNWTAGGMSLCARGQGHAGDHESSDHLRWPNVDDPSKRPVAPPVGWPPTDLIWNKELTRCAQRGSLVPLHEFPDAVDLMRTGRGNYVLVLTDGDGGACLVPLDSEGALEGFLTRVIEYDAWGVVPGDLIGRLRELLERCEI